MHVFLIVAALTLFEASSQDVPGAKQPESNPKQAEPAAAQEQPTGNSGSTRIRDGADLPPRDQSAAQATSQPTSQAASQPATKPAPRFAEHFSFPALDGAYVSFPQDFTGKMVLLTVWSTTCQHSREEIPIWKEVYDTFHKYNFEMVGVLIDKTREKPLANSLKALKKHGVTWPTIYDDAQAISDLFKVEDIPCSFIIDGDTGRIYLQGDQLRGKQLIKRVGNQLVGKKRRLKAASQPVMEKVEGAEDKAEIEEGGNGESKTGERP